jgi:uncharacterized membrane protein
MAACPTCGHRIRERRAWGEREVSASAQFLVGSLAVLIGVGLVMAGFSAGGVPLGVGGGQMFIAVFRGLAA